MTKEEKKEYHKEYYKKNKDKLNEKQKVYNLKNRDKILKRSREYGKLHCKTEAFKESQKKYTSKPEVKLKRNAQKRHRNKINFIRVKELKAKYRQTEKFKESERRYAKTEKRKAYLEIWRNGDKYKEYLRQYCKKNKCKRNEYNKKWRENNKDKTKEYYENNKEKYFDCASRRRAKYKHSDVTSKFRIELKAKTTHCEICGRKFKVDDIKHLDHIIPLNIGGLHIKSNVRYVHAKCNLQRPKNGSDIIQFKLLL